MSDWIAFIVGSILTSLVWWFGLSGPVWARMRRIRTDEEQDMRSPADLARELQKIADVITYADRHFVAQGQADAALHMAPTVRYNPLSVAVSTAKYDIHRLIAELEE